LFAKLFSLGVGVETLLLEERVAMKGVFEEVEYIGNCEE